MKQKLFILVSLPLVVLASACGSNNSSDPNANVAAVGVTCNPGQVVYNNTCQAATYGNPGYGTGYGSTGYQGAPVNVTIPTQSYCNGSQNYGYNSQYSCFNNGSSYQWSYTGGRLYYWW